MTWRICVLARTQRKKGMFVWRPWWLERLLYKCLLWKFSVTVNSESSLREFATQSLLLVFYTRIYPVRVYSRVYHESLPWEFTRGIYYVVVYYESACTMNNCESLPWEFIVCCFYMSLFLVKCRHRWNGSWCFQSINFATLPFKQRLIWSLLLRLMSRRINEMRSNVTYVSKHSLNIFKLESRLSQSLSQFLPLSLTHLTWWFKTYLCLFHIAMSCNCHGKKTYSCFNDIYVNIHVKW